MKRKQKGRDEGNGEENEGVRDGWSKREEFR